MLCAGHSSTFTHWSLLGKAEKSSHKKKVQTLNRFAQKHYGTLNPVANATGVYPFSAPDVAGNPKMAISKLQETHIIVVASSCLGGRDPF